jgi:alpha-1,3-rhamnosyl/mannosyltransferase
VLTIHDIQYLVYPDTFSSVKLAYLRRAVPAAVKRAAIIATPSTFVADTLARAFHVPPDRLVVVPNALPIGVAHRTSPEDLRATYDLPGPIVVYPAITYRHKNHATLLAAMAPLLRADSTLRLVLLGGVGPCEAELHATATSLGISDRVVRPGRIPAADRDGLYAMASVMAFPSRYEGFGIPVLEAMAAGCPVVASNVTALPEAVGDAGILVDPDDVTAWTDALRRVLGDATVSADLRARGYRRAAVFTAEATAAALRLAYTKAGEHR